MKNVILAVITGFILMGCGHIKKDADIGVKTVKEYVYVGVPAQFYTIRTMPTRPMSVNEYLSLTAEQKEYELIMYSDKLLTEISQYHALLRKLKQWDDEQRLIFDKTRENKDGK